MRGEGAGRGGGPQSGDHQAQGQVRVLPEVGEVGKGGGVEGGPKNVEKLKSRMLLDGCE